MRNFARIAAVATLISGAMPASAQTFPTRSLTILVPYVAGGPTDAAARIVGEHMGATLGQHVLIENISGGSGNISPRPFPRPSPHAHPPLPHPPPLPPTLPPFPSPPSPSSKALSPT